LKATAMVVSSRTIPVRFIILYMDIKIYLENNHSCRGSFELKQIRFE